MCAPGILKSEEREKSVAESWGKTDGKDGKSGRLWSTIRVGRIVKLTWRHVKS